MARDKVVLAYSGGLDTSVAIRWLAEEKDLDVVALAVDVGQGKYLEEVQKKALAVGAVESIVADVKEEFAHDFVGKALAANALYEGKYPLVSALSRPLIAKTLVETAHRHGARHIAHGCTGKGNDQVRFEVAIAALDPELQVLAPARDWGMSRDDSIEYAKRQGIPIPISKESPYSIDDNLWGRTIECGVLEDPWREPPAEAFELTVAPEQAPEDPAYLAVSFEAGLPVALDGRRLGLAELVGEVAKVGGEHGFGRVDMIENRLVGIKSREVYEVPGALALILAHRDLEDLTLERDLLHYKAGVDAKYAELVYYGLWFSPLKEALDAFVASTQQAVSGEVRLKFYKGSCSVAGRRSDVSLYDYDLATYEAADAFSHDSAKGFIELFGLPVKVWSKKRRRK
ncbi:MAG: argininosuccinate synthase [Actinobacteria bacterium]|nr:MAG: argininosuccinate synthase [Actinomycetota bacterium]